MAGTGDGGGETRQSAMAGLRQRHFVRLLEQIASSPQGVRQEELQQTLQLSRSSISFLLAKLGRALVLEEQVTSTGRRPVLYGINGALGVVAGIDIGTTRVTVALADLAGHLLDDEPLERQLNYDTARHPRNALNLAGLMVNKLLRAHGLERNDLAGVGVSLRGAVSQEARTLTDDTMHRWRILDVRDHLATRLGLDATVPLVLDNNANLALHAEQRWGSARGHDFALYVQWSTGIGSSVLADGTIYRGSRGVAAELGHVVLPLSKVERKALQLDKAPVLERCGRCGQQGCLQQVIGGTRVRNVLDVETIEEGLTLVHANERVRRFMATAGNAMGRAIGIACTLFDPGLVILGGAFHHAFDDLEPAIREGMESATFPQAYANLELVCGEVGDAASVRGAAAAALDQGAVPFLIERSLEEDETPSDAPRAAGTHSG